MFIAVIDYFVEDIPEASCNFFTMCFLSINEWILLWKYTNLLSAILSNTYTPIYTDIIYTLPCITVLVGLSILLLVLMILSHPIRPFAITGVSMRNHDVLIRVSFIYELGREYIEIILGNFFKCLFIIFFIIIGEFESTVWL